MSLLDDVSIVVTPNGYKAGTLYGVLPTDTEGSELITNGGFDTTSNWSENGGENAWSISGGKANCVAFASSRFFEQSNALATSGPGKTYKVVFTVSNYSQGFLRINVGGFEDGAAVSSNGTYTQYIAVTNSSANTSVYLQSNANTILSVDNISVKEWTASDMDVTRATAATRVDENGLVNYAQVVSNTDLVTDGDFTSGTNWSTPTGWDISDGKLKGTNLSSVSATQTGYSSFVGKTFEVVYTISDYSQGDVRIFLGGNVPTTNRSANGTFTEYILIDSGNTILYIQGINNFTGNIDNLSVKEVDRNNVPRIDYTGGGCPHILAEPQRTNLVINSNSSLNPNNTSISYSDITSPDGTQNGFKIQSTATGTASYVKTDSISFTDATFSVFVKYGNNQWLQFLTTNTGAHFFNFDVQNGVFGTSGVSTSNLKATQFDNGWYRVSGSFTGGSGVGDFRVYLSDASNTSYGTSTATSGDFLYSFGWQVEAGSYATSYIPTSGSTVTRNADVFTRDGIGSLINSTEGVLFVEMAAFIDNNDGSKSISLSSGGYSDNIIIQYTTNTNQIVFKTSPSYSTSIFQSFTVSDITQDSKMAFKYKLNDCSFWHNGIKLGSVSSFTPFSVGTLNVLNFNRGDGGEIFEGKVKQLQVYKTALTDMQLIQLTGEAGTHFFESYSEMAETLTYTIQ